MADLLPWQREIHVGQHFVYLHSTRPKIQYGYATLQKEHGVLLSVKAYRSACPEGREVRIQRRSLMYPINKSQMEAAKRNGWPADHHAVTGIVCWRKGGKA